MKMSFIFVLPASGRAATADLRGDRPPDQSGHHRELPQRVCDSARPRQSTPLMFSGTGGYPRDAFNLPFELRFTTCSATWLFVGAARLSGSESRYKLRALTH